MTEVTPSKPRPVSLVAILAILTCFALFLVPVRILYLRHLPAAPQNEAPERLSKDLAWKATPESRREALAELLARQAKQAGSYAWVDRKAGIVQVPIDRAMELIVREYGQGNGPVAADPPTK
jgi:hypothetical protein